MLILKQNGEQPVGYVVDEENELPSCLCTAFVNPHVRLSAGDFFEALNSAEVNLLCPMTI